MGPLWDFLGLKSGGHASENNAIRGGSGNKIVKGGRQFVLINKKDSFLYERAGVQGAQPPGPKTADSPKDRFGSQGVDGKGQSLFFGVAYFCSGAKPITQVLGSGHRCRHPA